MKTALKIVSFFLIFAVLIAELSQVLVTVDKTGYEIITDFYEQEEDSLDAVYIGSSNCFTYWNSMLAWKNYGITVHAYATNSNTLLSTEYLIKEARKTQPDALYIVNINTTTEKYTLQSSRNVLDSMPLSLNKLNFVRLICKTNGYTFSESLEYYIPLIKFHSRWSELEESDFDQELNSYKGASVGNSYLQKQTDVSSDFVTSDKTAELSETMTGALCSLLDYCDKEQVKVVFVTVPQAREKESVISKFNAVNSYISSRGYTVLNFTEMADELGISYETDYYNGKHTNIHGSIKFTDYLSEYLVENYGFTDKREDDNYTSWNTALEGYAERVSPYILDFEADFSDRNYQLTQPDMKIKKSSDNAMLVWNSVEGADGYAVYCKKDSASAWERIEDTSNTELTVTVPEKESSYYTVVPYTVSDGEYYYGSFSYTGVEVSA